MRFDILTIFPQLFDSFVSESILKRAQEKKLLSITAHDIRAFADNKHNQVDDRPFGGGPGMVLMMEPIYKALKSVQNIKGKNRVILLSPRGKQFTQEDAKRYTEYEQLVFISGRYEGVDARMDAFVDEQVSVGPYIVSGGEIPSMIIVEAVSRLIPGVLGNSKSLKDEPVDADDLVEAEYPVYTRPETFVDPMGNEHSVPEVLLSGNHAAIAEWRKKHSNK